MIATPLWLPWHRISKPNHLPLLMGVMGAGLLSLCVGCAALRATAPHAPEQVILLPAPESESWEAILTVLAQAPLKRADRQAGIVQTDWVEGWGQRRFGWFGGSWRHRYRLTLRLKPADGHSHLEVIAHLQERAPGGRLALRWQRIPSDGSIEQDFLQQVQAHVAQTHAL